MRSTNTAFKLYLKTTALFTAIFLSVAVVFVPIAPTVMSLMGVQSFLGITFSGQTEKTCLNVLLMGLDKGETRTDVMMLAQLNLENNGINILQIPRDTYINNNRYDKKINSAYGAGGPENSIKELQTIIDVEIDKYATVTTSGFRDLIDAVGGVYYDVPVDMNYDDPIQDLHIHLKKGYQLLDGDKAEQFVRCRSIYQTGDLGRIEAQSGFIEESIKQIIERNKSGEADTENLLRTIGEMVDTNFTLEEMLKYAPFLLNLNYNNINIMMLEGVAQYRNRISYFIADDEKNAQLIKEYFTPNISEADLSEIKVRDEALGNSVVEYPVSDALPSSVSASQVSVYILDYSLTDGAELEKAKTKLSELGYNVVGGISSKTAYSDKTYCVSSEDTQLSSKLASDLGMENYYINSDYANDADVILLIGKDE